MSRPPLPPFNAETATQKARMAEDAWNTRDPARVALAYTEDSRWRNRSELLQGREAIEAFLTRKWNGELDYRLIKEVWAFRRTASPCVSPTSGAMTVDFGRSYQRELGIDEHGPIACASPASTTFRSGGRSQTTGRRPPSRRSPRLKRSRTLMVTSRIPPMRWAILPPRHFPRFGRYRMHSGHCADGC